jgi:hypothetical protein
MKMKHEMSIMGKDGDTKCFWDPDDPDSVGVAQASFESYRGQGYRAARFNGDEQGDIINEFDPTAGRILFIPPLQGG